MNEIFVHDFVYPMVTCLILIF